MEENIQVNLKIDEYLKSRIENFCKKENIGIDQLIQRCVEHCESKNYF